MTVDTSRDVTVTVDTSRVELMVTVFARRVEPTRVEYSILNALIVEPDRVEFTVIAFATIEDPINVE